MPDAPTTPAAPASQTAPAAPAAPYAHTNSRGQTYYLHGKQVTLANGRRQQIYWFAREIKRDALDALPPDRRVQENPRTGLPYLKTA